MGDKKISEAARFTKRPVTIEAMQFDGSAKSASAICQWANAGDDASGHDDPTVSYTTMDGDDAAHNMVVWTLEDAMSASPGDWIIKGVKGEFYPCKPDIFELTYSPHLQGEAVPVAWIDLSKLSRSKMVCASAYQIDPSQVPVFNHPQPAKLSEVSGGSGEVSVPKGWRVTPHTDPWRSGDRWEVYGPNGGGGVNEHDIQCRSVRGLLDALAATGKQQVDPEWSLHDRVEFALRDAGFDLDEASRIALQVDGKQQVGEEVEDDRFPGGFADAIAYVNELEELAETLHVKVFGHESDGESGASTLLQMTIHQLDEKSEQVGEVQGDEIKVSRILLDRVQESLGNFIMDHGWTQADMDVADDLAAALASRQPVGAGDKWLFVESPGEFTERLRAALQEFDLLGAVRNVLIENPPTLVSRQAVQSIDLAENLLSVLIEEGVLSRNGRVFQKLRAMIDGRDAGAGVGS